MARLEPILNATMEGRIQFIAPFKLLTNQSSSSSSSGTTSEGLVCVLDTVQDPIVTVQYDAEKHVFLTLGTTWRKDPSISIMSSKGRKTSPRFAFGNGILCMSRFKGIMEILVVSDPQSDSSATNSAAKRLRSSQQDFQNLKQLDVKTYRIKELEVVDLEVFEYQSKPVVAVLYQHTSRARSIRTYEISSLGDDLKPGPFEFQNLGECERLMRAGDGLLGIGGGKVFFVNGKQGQCVMDIDMVGVAAQCRLECTRPESVESILLSDTLGQLFHFELMRNSDNSVEISAPKLLGTTSIPTCLVNIRQSRRHKLVFVGSHFGDSQLFYLGGEDGNQMTLCQELSNIGPIIDMCVVDIDGRSQNQVVTCSGGLHDGSLRIIQAGVGIHEYAFLDMQGIQNVFSLRPVAVDEDRLLLVSFIEETRMFILNDGPTGAEMEETKSQAFNLTQPTLLATNVDGYWVQITPMGVRVVTSSTKNLKSEWNAPARVNRAACSSGRLVLSCVDGSVFSFGASSSGDLKTLSTTKQSYEVSCIGLAHGTGLVDMEKDLCAIGFWGDCCVRVVHSSSLKEVSATRFAEGLVPRDCLLVKLGGVFYLFVTLGDGQMHYYELQQHGNLANAKQVSLGTRPIELTFIQPHRGDPFVFASCDHPAVIYANSNGKLVFSNVNVPEVQHVCTFHNAAYPKSLVLADRNGMILGSLDQIQKLHVRKVPLGEQARRMAFQTSSKLYGVVTAKIEYQGQNSMETNWFRVVDAVTLEMVDGFKLDDSECVLSIESMVFDVHNVGMTDELFVVGTAYSVPDEEEPRRGRILVFSISGRRIRQVTVFETKGAVYDLKNLNGKLVAGINSRVVVFSMIKSDEVTYQLTDICIHKGHIMALYLSTYGDFVAVGDLMKSISVLRYDAALNELQLMARDFNPHWMSEVQCVGDDMVIGGETNGNLIVCRRDTESVDDRARRFLKWEGSFHVGEFINCIQMGGLKSNPSVNVNSPQAESEKSLIFGTVKGTIGLLIPMKPREFFVLAHLQHQMDTLVPSLGRVPHSERCRFKTDRDVGPSPLQSTLSAESEIGVLGLELKDCHGFIDGDYVEKFALLSSSIKMEIVSQLNHRGKELADETNYEHALYMGKVKEEDIVRILDEMARLH